MLQHSCRLFENDISDKKAVYRQSRVMLSRPRFIALFNGPSDFPDRTKMRLSDAFKPAAGFDGVSLELEVDVYNVNHGRNSVIMESCAELAGYAYFVSRVRWHEAGARKAGTGKKEATANAIVQAVKDCREAGFLREYWETLSGEEMNMLVTEWDMETALEVREEEGFERGRYEGRNEGRNEGRYEGRYETARSALAEGASIEFVRKITGLDAETLAGLTV